MSLPQLSPEEFSRDRGINALAADVIPRAIAMIAVGLRFYARHVGGSKYSWDDWLILSVAILFIPAIVVEGKMTELGLGQHLQWVLVNKPQGLPLYAKLAYFDQLVYSPMVSPIKCSILYLYIRLFGSRPSVRWACYTQIILVVIWGLVTFFLFVFQCKPVEVAWSPTRTGGTCFQYAPLFIGTNTVNVVMDFGILITPLPSIWQLKMAPAKKAWVTGILMFGACESIFSATRLGVLSQLDFIDVTWDHADALIWSTLETAVGVICACVPVLGPLLPRSSKSTTKGSRPTDNNYGSYGNGSTKPRRGYSKFGETITTPQDTDSTGDEHELVTRQTPSRPTTAPMPFHIQRTVDWEVSSEKGQKLERESADGEPPHAL